MNNFNTLIEATKIYSLNNIYHESEKDAYTLSVMEIEQAFLSKSLEGFLVWLIGREMQLSKQNKFTLFANTTKYKKLAYNQAQDIVWSLISRFGDNKNKW